MTYVPIEQIEDVDLDKTSFTIRDYAGGKHQYEMSVYPTELTFPDVTINTESTPQSIIVNNIGLDDIDITGIEVVGDFILKSVIPTKIIRGNLIGISVAYKPKQSGSTTGGIYIKSNSALGTQFVKLIGQ